MFCFKQVMIGTSKNIFGFDPRSVPGCVVWLDAADSNTLTLSGANITAWRDKSVLGNNVTSISATPPTFSSVDSSVNFTAASCNFLRGNLSDTYSNNATVFAVASVTPTPELSAGVVTTFAGNGTGSYVNGTGTNATFQFPGGVTLDGSGTVYVIDTWNFRIRRITPLGVVTLLAGSGTATFGDGTGASASFAYPSTGVTDNAGNLYVADTNNHRIRRIVISTGVVTTLAGNGTASSVNGTGGSATFHTPVGITTNLNKTLLFVTELYGNRVRQIVISTAVVTTLAGSGTGASTDGVGTNASFFNPIGIAPDPFGNLYVGDPSSHRIRKINIASTVVTTFAGSSLGTANGTGTNAQFNYPSGVTCDENGNVYIAEADTPRIRKITPGGVVTTFAGSGTATSVDGTGTNATFSKPRQLFYNPDGIIYVADEVGHRIRRMNTKTVNLTYAQLSSLGSNAATENNLMGQSFEIQGVTPNLLTFVENSSNPTGLGSNIQTYLSNVELNTKLILANTSTYSGSTFNITSILNGTTQTFSSRSGTLVTNSSNVNTYNKYAIGGMLNTTATVPTSFNGKVFEYLVFNNALTSAQRQQIEGYLAWKWTRVYTPTIPTSISGCTLWLDASDSSTITLNGANMTLWTDKSGNGKNMSPYSTYSNATVSSNFQNGRNVLNFSGAAVYQAPASSAVYPVDVYVVLALKDTTTHVDVFSVVTNSATDNFNALSFGEFTTSRWHNGSTGYWRTPNTVSMTNETSTSFLLMNWSISNNNFILRRNGVMLTQSAWYSFTLTAGSIFQIGYRAAASVFISPGAAGLFKGYIGEIVAFNSQLGNEQRQQLESYLSWKWNISNMYQQLSTSNPYFSLRPHLRMFRPTDITQCILWLDAADSSTLTLQAGNKVSAWLDKSSNGFVMSNATTLTQPTYVTSGWNGSYPAVQVNGSGSGQHNFLSNAAFNGFNTAAWDIYAVVKHSANPYEAGLMWINPSGSFIIISAGIGTDQFSYTINSNGGWPYAPTVGVPTTQNPYLFQVYSTGTAFSRRLNGVVPGLTEQTVSYTGTARTGTYPFFLANPSGGWSVPTTHFGEMLMFNRTLSDPERLQIEGYLSTKWGLTQTSFSSTAFSPTSIAGCQLWFDASDTASLTPSSITTGTKVSQWNDKSGNNRHMSNSTAASQPTYSTSNFNGSLPSVYFRGNNEVGTTNANILSNAASTVLNSTTWDIYVAFKPTGGQEAIFWNDPTSAVVVIAGNTKVYDANYSILYGGWRLAPNDGACRGGECQLFQAYSTGTTIGKRVNGGFEGSQTQTASFSWPSRSSNSELSFCRPSSGGWSEGNLAIAEVIVYNSVLSDANRSNVQTYLTNKWKIGRGLQLGHPYYSFPPARPVGGKIVVTTFAGNGTASSINGTGTSASFNNPRGLTMSAAGNIYVPEFQGNRVRKVTPEGVVTILAGTGGAGAADNVIGTSATFNGPYHASVDNQENVYLSESYNHKIRKITSSGVVTTVAGDGFGTGGNGRSVDGVGTNASFNVPWMNVVNRAGTILYVAEQVGHRIRKVDLTTGVVTTVFGNGTASSVNGVGTNATFNAPSALSLNENETIMYECDNNIIRKINLIDNTVTTLAGSTTAGTLDGIGTNARFTGLNRSCVDQYDGSVFITDFSTLRKISPEGVVTTLAGTNTGSYLDGTGEVARFNQPQGLALDKGGTFLYIADRLNQRIRKVFFN
jgi:sugar lactone lactonase YvrE